MPQYLIENYPSDVIEESAAIGISAAFDMLKVTYESTLSGVALAKSSLKVVLL